MNQNLQSDLKNQESQNELLEEEISYLKKKLTGSTNEVRPVLTSG